MLISQSRFRKIINEELKKLIKEAAPTATKPKGTAYTQAQIDAANEQSRRTVENTVNGWVSFLTKKGKQVNAQVLKRKWNEIKNNQYEDKDKLYQWADPYNAGTGMSLMGYLTGLVDPYHIQDFEKTFGVPYSEEAIATQLGIQTEKDISAVNAFYSAKNFATSLFNIVNMQMGSQLNVKKQFHPNEKGGMAPRNAAPGAPPTPVAKPVAAASTATAPASTAPAPAATATAAAQTIPYTVRQGDSITKILQTYYGFK